MIYKSEIVELPPFAIADCPCRPIRIHFIQTRLHFLLFRTFKIQLPPSVGVWCLSLVFRWSSFPSAKGKRCKAYIDVPVFDRGNFLFVLLVYSRKVPGLICWNPFPVVLFQAAPCRKLQFSAVFLHGNIYPCTALIILDNPSYLTVDAVYCTNHLLMCDKEVIEV